MNILKLTVKEAANVVCGDTPEWKSIEQKVVDQSRWSLINEGVFQHISSGKFYRVCWSSPATEQQECDMFWDDPVVFTEVVKKDITVSTFVPVE